MKKLTLKERSNVLAIIYGQMRIYSKAKDEKNYFRTVQG